MGAAAEHLGAGDRKGIATRLLREPREHGGEVWAHCPWHEERTPGDAFSYSPEQDVAYCNSCQGRGDLIDLYCVAHGLEKSEGFREFMREFCPDAARGGPRTRGRTPRMPGEGRQPADWQPENPEDPPELWRKKCGQVMAYGLEQLQENRDIQDWLRERGISLRTAVRFGLGWIPKSYYREREAWGVEPAYHESGKEKKLWIPRGLVIPYLRHQQLQRLRFRRFEDDELPRYYVLPGSSRAPLWIRRSTEASGPEAVVIVETELDALMLWELVGDLVHIAALGSSSAKPHDPELLQVLRDADRILLSLDHDEAGARALRWWRERYASATYWPVPVGKDPGDAYAQGVDIREWILEGLPPAMRIRAERGEEIAEREQARDAARTAGPSAAGSQGKGEGSAPEQGSQQAGQAQDGPQDAVDEAIRLMRLLGARVSVDEDGGATLEEDEARSRRRWGASRKLSALLFADPDVSDLLRAMGPGTWSARDLEGVL